jgi:hypothetical protein
LAHTEKGVRSGSCSTPEDAMDRATALLTAATALVLSTIVFLIVWRSRYR